MAGIPLEQNPRPNPETHKPEALRKLEARWDKNNFVCVGLDSEYNRMPDALQKNPLFAVHKDWAIEKFNRDIIDSTSALACAYKPNIAFYEAEGKDGLEGLNLTMRYLKGRHPEIPVILDVKRGDIGNTNKGYVKMAFDEFQSDAITVSPYLGSSYLREGERKLESLAPFLEKRDKLIFVLCRTSNSDAGELQDLPIALNALPQEYKAKFGNLDDLADKIESSTAPLYLVLAHKLARDWNVYGNVGLVVGATYPEEMVQIRKVVGDMPILMPGLGAQKGDAQRAVQGGINSKKQGLVVNSSRGIIFASNGADFAEAARRETERFTAEINKYRLTA